LRTAEEDLRAAQGLLSLGLYAHACFQAQQAGEKAVKALWHHVDADPWGHSVKRLLADFPRKGHLPDLDTLMEQASLLDQFYIPTRYPNGLPDLTPGEVYARQDADRGIEAARMLVEAARKWLQTALEYRPDPPRPSSSD